MNIAYDYEIFVRQKQGGISRYFYEIIRRLATYDDININLFAGINNSHYSFSDLGSLAYLYEKKFRFADKVNFLLSPLNNFIFERRNEKLSSDILHKTYFSNVGQYLKVKRIITLHDMTHELFPQYFSKADDTAELKAKCIKNSDGIICVSQSTLNDLLKLYDYPLNRLTVIHHANSLNAVVSSERIVKEPYLLFVGMRWGYKNFNMLLTAFNISNSIKNNFKLVCFGGDDFNFSESLYINENSLSGKVIYLQGNDDTLANLYQYAEVLVYPTLYEGFGFPPLEAMNYGCPVLASCTSSIPEVAGNAACFFEPDDMDDFLSKLDVVLSDKNLRMQLVTKGYERIKAFSWDKATSLTKEFYQKICNLN